MDCDAFRPELLDHARGRSPPPLADALRAHLAGCEACRRELEAERALDAALRERLPHPVVPPALRRQLEAAAGAATAPRPSRRRAVVAALAGLAAGVAVSLAWQGTLRREDPLAGLAAEAVNDHLRVLVRQRPLDLESSAQHQVKPWFEGRLDFAPAVPSPDVPDLRLDGGAVGYFGDRPAAVVGYHLRRHAVTLLAFRAEGLAWPGPRAPGPAPGIALRRTRGFGVAFWRAGEVGYALVADVSSEELGQLARTFAAVSAG